MMIEWQNNKKGSMYYADKSLPYYDYPALVTNLNDIFGKVLDIKLYYDKQKDHVLYEFLEKIDLPLDLASCMYLCIFVLFRCTGNEYKDDMLTKYSWGNESIKSVRDCVYYYFKIVNRTGHGLNDGLWEILAMYPMLIKPLSQYYEDVLRFVFFELDLTDEKVLKNITKVIGKRFEIVRPYKYGGYYGQTAYFSALEDVYEKYKGNNK
jgi:hypothetical protein